MEDTEEIKLCRYVIRPRTDNWEQAKKLQIDINKSLADKKLLRFCGNAAAAAGPVVLGKSDNGYPAMQITCSADLARLITNMPRVFRLEPNGFWEPL